MTHTTHLGILNVYNANEIKTIFNFMSWYKNRIPLLGHTST